MRNLLCIFFVVILSSGCKNSVLQDDVLQKSRKESNQVVKDISEIRLFLENQEKAGRLHGTVLIADGDTILLREAYGFRDLELSEKHTVFGKIGLASLPKMLTAISIMQLETQGKIDIDAPINFYLKDVENKNWKDISIKELLSHTSGLGFYWDYASYDDSYGLDDLYKLIKESDTDPREQGIFNYSNNGYIVLGKIIEEVANMSYEQYIEQNILSPLNMHNTEIGLPDGNSYTSTIDDLLKLSRGLRNYQLLKKKTLMKMTTKQSEEDYGLGFRLAFKGKSKVYGHPGGWSEGDSGLGIASALDIINDKYTAIILTNRNPRVGGAKARQFIINYLANN